jgi:hypothetical protein
MPTYWFSGNDEHESFEMPLDMLERKYYPISGCTTPLGNETITFNDLIERMKTNYVDDHSVRFTSSPCQNGVLPTRFLFKGVSQGDNVYGGEFTWVVPAYTVDIPKFKITFDTNGPYQNYDTFVQTVTKQLAERREAQLKPLPLPPKAPEWPQPPKGPPKQKQDGGTRRRRRTRRR